ncbi:unnamed protein product [Musa banksii]
MGFILLPTADRRERRRSFSFDTSSLVLDLCKSQASRNDGVGFKGTNSRPSQSSSAGILPKPSSGSYSKPTTQRGKTKGVNLQPSPQGATSGDNPPRPEFWAGPSFSNSPAPSSLPIPKFSFPEKPK